VTSGKRIESFFALTPPLKSRHIPFGFCILSAPMEGCVVQAQQILVIHKLSKANLHFKNSALNTQTVTESNADGKLKTQ
jgi:hypothetical protein